MHQALVVKTATKNQKKSLMGTINTIKIKMNDQINANYVSFFNILLYFNVSVKMFEKKSMKLNINQTSYSPPFSMLSILFPQENLCNALL